MLTLTCMEPGIIILIFDYTITHRKMIGKVSGIQYTFVEVVAFSQMTLNFSIGPTIPLTWIIPTPTLSLVVWLQWNYLGDGN